MREYEIDPKNCLVGCGDISINQINQRIDFKGVEKCLLINILEIILHIMI